MQLICICYTGILTITKKLNFLLEKKTALKLLPLSLILLNGFAGKSQTITVSTINPLSYCAGAQISVGYSITGTFNAGNVFTVQLSDATGSFVAPDSIGSLNSTSAGTIIATIPPGQAGGSQYRVRVRSGNPIITSAGNGSNITITQLPTISITPSPSNLICAGVRVTFTATTTNAGTPTYQWTKNSINIPGANANIYIDSTLVSNDSIRCVLTNSTACAPSGTIRSAPVVMILNTLPGPLTTTATPSTICPGGTSQLQSGSSRINFSVAPITYQFIPVPANAGTGPIGDDVVGPAVPIPFGFNFFGNTYNSFYISTNGNIQFGPSLDNSYTPGPLPNQTVRNFVALCWADVVVSSNNNTTGVIKYFVDGISPNRKMIIDFSNCAFYSSGNSTGSISGQIWLYETSRIVEIHLKNSQGLASTGNGVKVLGVNNATGTIGAAAPGRNGTAWQTTTPEAWRFTPPEILTFKWTPSSFLSSDTAESPIATLNATTTYNVAVTDQITGCVSHGSVTVTVLPTLTPSVSTTIETGSNPTCSTSVVTFKATPTAGGTTPTYQWQKNGVNIPGATSTTYSTGAINNNDVFRCVMTSDYLCRTTNTVNSNAITMTVIGLPPTVQNISLTGCNSVLYQNITYTSSTVKRDSIKNTIGCDSIIVIANIVVTHITPQTRDTSLSSCNTTITYLGITYTASTILRDTIRSYQGCDSIYKIATITITTIPPLQPPTNLIPVNSRTGLSIPITFSWALVPNALLYDFYLWKASDPEPSNPLTANLTQINFNYSGILTYGTAYKWRVVAKNGSCSSVSVIQTFTTRFLPDLIAENIVPATTGFSGQALSVNWQVRNRGTGATPVNAQWIDQVYLSKDAVLDLGTDIYLGAVPNASELMPNTSYQQTATFTLPQGINDNYYAFVVTNAYNYQLLESDYNNNTGISTGTSAIQLTPPPDLWVPSIIPPNFAFSGQTINYNWKVTNKGTGPTVNGNWTDNVYLTSQSDSNLTGAIFLGSFNHTGLLKVDSSYTTFKTAALPQGISGKYYIYVRTDIYNQIYEHASENNNLSRSDSIIITLTPPVDLIVVRDSIVIPSSASNRQNITVKWTIENQGGSATGGANWSDNIYLSKTAVYIQDSATLLGSFSRPSALDAGLSYSTQQSVTAPSNISGPYYIYIRTDAQNTIYENVYENNNISRSPQAINILSPDLIVSKITAPLSDSSGKIINVDWSVKNNGPGTLLNSNITDRIFISLNPVYSLNNNIELKQFGYGSGQIASGDSILKSTTVQLPDGISGNYYLYIQTDINNNVYENTNENNNIRRSGSPINVILSPWADLQVLSVTLLADSATAGDVVPVSYTVKNTGTRKTPISSWTDNLYISRFAQFDSSTAIPVRAFSHNGILEKDSSYQVNSSVQLPQNAGGAIYYVYLFTDATHAVFEHTDESNNIKRGDTIYIKNYPPVDLAVTDIVAPDSASSGNPVFVSWKVENRGMATTLQSQWKDALFLSTDTVLSSTDIFVQEVNHFGSLLPGSNYTMQNNFVLPNGVTGRYYLLLVTDRNDVNNDVNRQNNYKIVGSNGDSASIIISLTPPPDLVVTSITVPDRGYAGQPVSLTFTIKNAGPGEIKAGASWTEKIYLSTDLLLTASDPVIGLFSKTGPLNANQEYTQSIQVFLPISASGNYVLFIKTDANENIYEHTAEQNNTRYDPITVDMQLLSDLVVSDFELPAEAIAGDTVTIKWKIKNVGLNPATGYMRDAVYLSLDSLKSVNDALLTSSPANINIAPQGEITRSFNGELSGVALNDYHVLVHTDVLNNIYETSDSNNISASGVKLRVTVRELPIDVLTARNMADNKEVYYRIEIPDSLTGESLLITLKADSLNGNNEMYLRFAEAPTRAVYDFSHSQPHVGNQEILVPDLRKGTYYLMVYGNTTSGNVQAISLLAKILKFEIRSVNATTGGNTGQVTLQVKGSKFGNVTNLRLTSDSGVIASSNILIKDPTTIFATFNLAGAKLNVYDIVAQNAVGDTAVLPDGFTIVTGNSGGLVVNVISPPSTRPSNVISMTVEFTNSGNTDLINPVLKMTSLAGAPIAFNVSELLNNTQELTLNLQEFNGPVGRLRPGASGSVIVYAKALTSLSFMLIEE